MKLFMGLMSGTSMDGIDAAISDLTNNSFVEGLIHPYSSETRYFLEKVLTANLCTLKDYSQLNTLLGREFAQAALNLLDKTAILPTSIEAIGSHGQTICHDARSNIPYTLQLGCPHTIAELTGITVVADFRTRDLVRGGQGAPLAPLYHQALFKACDYPLAVVNIGGIANLSYLKNAKNFSGYDLGPGNCLMDAWIQKHFSCPYDKQGTWAESGKVIQPLLTLLLADAYFKQPTPKSIGKEYFSLSWLNTYLKPDYAAVDIQATLLKFTAVGIANGVKELTLPPKELLVCGGGVHNNALLKTLANLLPTVRLSSTLAYNVNPDYIEALMFAWLAEKTINAIPLELESITGSPGSAILGAIYPAGIDKRNSLRV